MAWISGMCVGGGQLPATSCMKATSLSKEQKNIFVYILLDRYEPIFQISSVPVSVIASVFGLRGSQSRFHAGMAAVRAFCDLLDATSTEWMTSGCNIYRVDDLLHATSTEWTTS